MMTNDTQCTIDSYYGVAILFGRRAQYCCTEYTVLVVPPLRGTPTAEL